MAQDRQPVGALLKKNAAGIRMAFHREYV